MGLQGRGIIGLAAAVALAFPGGASAAEVIGQTGFDAGNCSNRAFVQHDLTSGPSYSPSSYGVITAWSSQANGSAGQTLQLAVLNHDSDLGYTILGRDSVRTLASLNSLNTFTGLRLPIEAGQLIGVYEPPGSNAACEFMASVGDKTAFSDVGNPPDNVPTGYNGFDEPWRVNAQAVVEPDTDRDVFGDETQDNCVGTPGPFDGCPSTVTALKLKQKGDTKVKATITVPGQGSLEVGSASDPALASAAAKKTVKAKSLTLAGKSAQQVKLTLKLTKSARRTLSQNGKLKVKVKAVYTPVGGPAGSLTAKKKLKS
jgi:hypothetical protein